MCLTFPVFGITAYLPDSLVPHYISLRDRILSLLGAGSDKPDASEGSRIQTVLCGSLHTDILSESNQARQALSDAEHNLKLTREEEQTARDDFADLFDTSGFGPEGEWKKLDRLCLEKDTGEFVSSCVQSFRY